MLKFTPLLLALIYGLVAWHFSAWRLKRDLDTRATELADPGLRPLMQKLAQALDLPRIRVNLLEEPAINGLAAPDGRIFLTRGFYEAYRRGDVSAEELTSVVAHELGHVALGHSRRRMIDFAGQNALRTALLMTIGRFLPGIGALLINGLFSLLAAKLSRGDEYEADAYAAALMTKAGIGTDPQVSLLARLEKLAGGGGRGTPVWLMSHPKTPDRIAAIEKLAEGWQARGQR